MPSTFPLPPPPSPLSYSTIPRRLGLFMLNTFARGLRKDKEQRRTRVKQVFDIDNDLPPLEPCETPARVLQAHQVPLPRSRQRWCCCCSSSSSPSPSSSKGTLASMVEETGMWPLAVLQWFISIDISYFLFSFFGFVVLTSCQLLIPYLIQLLLDILMNSSSSSSTSTTSPPPPPSPDHIPLAYGLAACMLISAFGQVIGFLFAWNQGTQIDFRAEVVLMAIGAIKGLLLSSQSRNDGEQQAVMSRYSTILTRNFIFGAIHMNTWVPILFISLAMFNLTSLLGEAAAWSGFLVQAGVTILSFRIRSYLRKVDRSSNEFAVQRVGALRSSLTNMVPLRAMSGWTAWYRGRIQALRVEEVKLLRRSQLFRVLVDTAFSSMQTAVVITAFMVFAATSSSPLTPTVAFASITWITSMAGPMKGIPALIQAFADIQVFLGKFRENLSRPEVEMSAVQDQWGRTKRKKKERRRRRRSFIKNDSKEGQDDDDEGEEDDDENEPSSKISKLNDTSAHASEAFEVVAEHLKEVLSEATTLSSSDPKHADKRGEGSARERKQRRYERSIHDDDDDWTSSSSTSAAAPLLSSNTDATDAETTSSTTNAAFNVNTNAHMDGVQSLDDLRFYTTISSSPPLASAPQVEFENATLGIRAEEYSAGVSSSSSSSSSTAATGAAATVLVQNVTFTCSPSTLTILLSPTGGGKSTVLRSLVGNVDILSGRVRVHGNKVGYVSQDPWLQRASIRENIVFQSSYRAGWYQEVIKACALEDDFARIALSSSSSSSSSASSSSASEGDLMMLSNQGANISGGQRARIALARAVYADANVYALDDIFASLDPVVSEIIWKEAIVKLLLGRNKTVVLATNAVQFVSRPQVTTIVYLERAVLSFSPPAAAVATKSTTTTNTSHKNDPSTMIKSGSYVEMQSTLQTANLLTIIKASSASSFSSSSSTEAVSGSGSSSSSSSVNTNIAIEASVAPPAAALDKQQKPAAIIDTQSLVTWQGMKVYLSSIGWIYGTLVITAFIGSQVVLLMQSWWLKIWVENDADSAMTYFHISSISSQLDAAAVFGGLGVVAALLVCLRMFILTLSTTHASQVLHNEALTSVLSAPLSALNARQTGDILNRFEKDLDSVDGTLRQQAALVGSTIVSLLGTVVVISATSPYVIIWMVLIGFIYKKLGVMYRAVVLRLRSLDAASNSSAVQYWSEIQSDGGATLIRALGPTSVALSVYLFIRRLDNVMRTHLSSQIGSGLASNLLSFTGNTLTVVAAFAAILLHSNGQLSVAGTGLLLSYAYSFPSDMTTLVSNIGSLEQAALCVQRLAEFVLMRNEDDEYRQVMKEMSRDEVENAENEAPPERNGQNLNESSIDEYNIPSSSSSSSSSSVARIIPFHLTFKNVGLSYYYRNSSSSATSSRNITTTTTTTATKSSMSLHGCSLDIPPGCKVGIVGRTGSGKSSLLNALLRLYPYQEGRILVNGKDIARDFTSADEARRVCAVMMQGGALIAGTFRENLLGPYSIAVGSTTPTTTTDSPYWWHTDDDRILSFIRTFSPHLASKISSLPEGLNYNLLKKNAGSGGAGGSGSESSGKGGDLSKGECALLGIARLLLSQEISKDLYYESFASIARQKGDGGQISVHPPPGCLLLDEPTADIDAVAQSQIFDCLLGNAKKDVMPRPETVVAICHRREHLHRFDMIAVMENGSIVKFGKPGDVLPTL